MNLPVTQAWTHGLSMMQQTVLLTAIRGPDGLPKYGCVKMLLRWFRRCVVFSAMDRMVLASPLREGGGSFTGPSVDWRKTCGVWQTDMDEIVSEYLRSLDAVPHHFQMHFMHAVEILGYKHPVADVRQWWGEVYLRLVNDLHLHPETEAEMDDRLGDSRSGWLARADEATAT